MGIHASVDEFVIFLVLWFLGVARLCLDEFLSHPRIVELVVEPPPPQVSWRIVC